MDILLRGLVSFCHFDLIVMIVSSDRFTFSTEIFSKSLIIRHFL